MKTLKPPQKWKLPLLPLSPQSEVGKYPSDLEDSPISNALWQWFHNDRLSQEITAFWHLNYNSLPCLPHWDMVKKNPGMVHASPVLIQITGLYTHGISCFFLHPVPPPSNHYIHLSITFPGSKNVTHIYTNVRTHHGSPLHWNSHSSKTVVQKFGKNHNTFHSQRGCEGVVLTPPTKESIFLQIPERMWRILQSHSLVFCSMEADQNTPTLIHASF